MFNRRTVEYEYKMISSFYDNYIKKHNYLLIKSIVVGYDSSDSRNHDLIRKFHRFLLNIIINNKKNILKELERCFSFSFGAEIGKTEKKKVSDIVKNKNLSDIQKSLRLLELAILEKNINYAFCFFILSGIFLNLFFKDYVVIPVYLFEKLEGITENYTIRDVYYKSIIELNLKYHETDLKNKIIKCYNDSKDEIKSYGVEELWLFGSIIDGTYHDHSDIDVVLKMKKNTSFIAASNFIQKFNKINFYRESDVLENDDFDNLNKNLEKIKVI